MRPPRSRFPTPCATPTERVTVDKVADGVWFLAGGSHNSVAIEMKDHMILVETPLNDGRSLPVIDEVKKLVPGKPIRYVVNSHHTSITRAACAPRRARARPSSRRRRTSRTSSARWRRRARSRPTISRSPARRAKVIAVNDKMVLRDSSRTVEIYRTDDSHHADTLLMVYLPKEKLLIEADSFTPGPPNSPPPAQLNPHNTNLVDNLGKLNLPIDRILPLHGRVVPVAELYTSVGSKAPN